MLELTHDLNLLLGLLVDCINWDQGLTPHAYDLRPLDEYLREAVRRRRPLCSSAQITQHPMVEVIAPFDPQMLIKIEEEVEV